MYSIPVLLLLVGLTGLGITILVVTGLKGARRAHFATLAFVLPTFVTTVLVAEGVGRQLAYEPTSFRVHMFFAHTATAALLASLVTGVLRLIRPARALPHRLSVFAFLGLLVGALGTGAWMISEASPLEATQPEAFDLAAQPGWQSRK